MVQTVPSTRSTLVNGIECRHAYARQVVCRSPRNTRNPRFPSRVTGAAFVQLAGGEGGIRTLVAGIPARRSSSLKSAVSSGAVESRSVLFSSGFERASSRLIPSSHVWLCLVRLQFGLQTSRLGRGFSVLRAALLGRLPTNAIGRASKWSRCGRQSSAPAAASVQVRPRLGPASVRVRETRATPCRPTDLAIS